MIIYFQITLNIYYQVNPSNRFFWKKILTTLTILTIIATIFININIYDKKSKLNVEYSGLFAFNDKNGKFEIRMSNGST